MTYLLGTLLFVAAGYSLARLLDISRNHLIYDISIGWFVGAGYYSLAYFVSTYALGLSVSAWLSFLILLSPILILLLRTKSLSRSILQSAKNVMTTKYLPETRLFSITSILVVYCAILFISIAVHSVSTPSNADDALRLRALTPMLAYDNNFSEITDALYFQNGIWPSFVTVLFWHVNGSVEHFYVNYTIITSLFFFLLILFFAPAIRGNRKQGIYAVFLALSIPLFAYHGTTTYADVRLAMPYALGFLFFSFYVRDNDIKELKTLILFFSITCFIKNKGEIAGITGLSMAVLFIVYTFVFKGKRPETNTIYLLLPVLCYFAIKNYHTHNLKILTDLVQEASSQIIGMAFIPDEVTITDEYITKGFWESLFLSGNFGIIFYVLLINVLFNIRKILLTPLAWEVLFLGLVFTEIFYYTVIRFDSIELHAAVVNRTVIMFALVSSLFLSSLWSKQESSKGNI
ncbi:MAG: hypothetical protein IEMM0002_0339 [bacterium]|nr:MAG: hypothetical protein IEMM0002_0339 [bacterium]